ncbi:helix-turn-helix domain-containing protein [Bradyrhizobium elkanii]|uniref:helix-turn-helix domain-containing protein n=1 Tax=Bradyrhizobium elkanii TaxID=29448 RepID=UPI00056E3E16|nr:helix-turn-helix domain-containing protein [Bradyrhizobium elkanii]
MTYKSRENNRSDYNTDPVVISPDGVHIQITAGNKWKFNRAVQRDVTGLYSRLQKDIMTILIDSTNEGFGSDRSRWGYAYPGFERLAAECGCTRRAVIENIAKLEQKKVLTVKRSAGKRASGKRDQGGGGGRNKSNMYFLRGWNEFGRVENGDRQTVNSNHCFVETVNGARETVNAKHETVNRAHVNSEPGSPDSSSYSASEPIFTDTHTGRRVDCPLTGDDPMETALPANHRSMSQRERFEFLKSVWGSFGERPGEDESVWRQFCAVEAMDHRTGAGDFVMMLQDIDLERGVDQREPVDRTKVMSFSAYLDDWLSCQEDQPAASANDNCQRPARKVSGIDWVNDPPF